MVLLLLSLHGPDSTASPGHWEQPGGPHVQERERSLVPEHGAQQSPHSLHGVQHSISYICVGVIFDMFFIVILWYYF